MTKAVRFHKTGGPEVLQLDDVQVGEPGPGQVRIRHTAIGVNFIDTYQRSGLYPMQLPPGRGQRGRRRGRGGRRGRHRSQGRRPRRLHRPAGLVLRAAPGARRPPGEAARRASATSRRASMMLKGMTVQYLIHRTYPVKPGDTVLWHAAAGGVGLIACQWLKALGVTIIGTVGSDRKDGARQGARRRPRDQLLDGEFRRAREGDHRRQGRAGGVRLGRQDHLGRVARLPAPARADGVLRQRLGPGAAGEPRHPLRQGLAVRHASDARHPHREPRRPGRALERAVRQWSSPAR